MRLLARVFLACLACSFLACAGTAPLAPKAVELNRTGAEALAQGHLETAEARFSLALEYHPRFVEALTNLGLVEMQRGNLARAKLLFERAKRINSDLAQPHHALGVIAERELRPDLASEHYRDALKVNPGFGPSRANWARMLFAAGRYYEARDQFAKLVEVAPDMLVGRTGLAETLLQLERTTESNAIVERARTEFGGAPELMILEARRHLREGRPEDAEAILEPLLSGHDDNARAAYSWLAATRLAKGDRTGALEAADHTFELDRNDAVATFVVARALSEAGDRRAEAWIARARKLAPRSDIDARDRPKAPAPGSAR